MPAKLLVAALLSGALALAGCSADPGPREATGAIVGGVAGGLIGSTLGHGRGRAAATILGAALGAVVGGEVGRRLDDADRERAYYAAQASFRANRVEVWENRANGHRGRIVIRRSFRDDRRYLCRDFEHTVWIDGEPELVEGTACEMPDGSWRVVG